MTRFAKLHPTVQLIWFLLSMTAVLTFHTPVISAVSLLCALLYAFVHEGRRAGKQIGFSLCVIAAVSLFNFLFAHYGNTVLFTLKNTDFTLQALFYGFHQGMLVAALLLWFHALGKCLDSERIVYLFRFAPKLALLLTMVLGFLPRFLTRQRAVREARLALNGGRRPRGLKETVRAAAGDLSALTSYALEGSIITADSMTARAYRPGVIRRGNYRYTPGDVAVLVLSLMLFGFALFEKLIGNFSFVFEPDIYIRRLSIPGAVCFLLFGLMPAAISIKEELQWKLSRSEG